MILYNYPGAVSGIDMDSDLLIKLAQHPNIIGTKFTCGNTGKLTRVALATDAKTPSQEGSGYMAFGGMCDFTVQTLASGGSGIIAGGANVMPKVCVKVWNLYAEGKVEEAIAPPEDPLQGRLGPDQGRHRGYQAGHPELLRLWRLPRRPLKRLDKAQVAHIEEWRARGYGGREVTLRAVAPSKTPPGGGGEESCKW